MGKRANLSWSVVIFLILNVLVFSVVFFFVSSVGNGSLVYEQKYAKEIALMIDKAEPGMELSFNFEKGLEIARKNKISEEGLFTIDNSKNLVTVRLSNKGGYSMNFFTDYIVESELVGNKLILEIKENEG